MKLIFQVTNCTNFPGKFQYIGLFYSIGFLPGNWEHIWLKVLSKVAINNCMPNFYHLLNLYYILVLVGVGSSLGEEFNIGICKC